MVRKLSNFILLVQLDSAAVLLVYEDSAQMKQKYNHKSIENTYVAITAAEEKISSS